MDNWIWYRFVSISIELYEEGDQKSWQELIDKWQSEELIDNVLGELAGATLPDGARERQALQNLRA